MLAGKNVPMCTTRQLGNASILLQTMHLQIANGDFEKKILIYQGELYIEFYERIKTRQ